MIKLKEKFKGKLKENEPMSRHTTFKIGGPARFFLEVKSSEELIEAVRLAREEGVEWTVIGNGSNLLVNDKGFDGLVIKMSDVRCQISDVRLTVGAGLSLRSLAEFALKNSLTGLEWAYGVPGTAGGAVVMNAGCFGREMDDLVAKVSYFDTKEIKKLRNKEIKGMRIKELSNKQCEFGYRESVFAKQPEWIVLEVELKLKKEDKMKIKDRMTEYLKTRNEKLDLGHPSAGSVFKKYEIARGEKLKPKLERILKKEHPEFLRGKYIPAGWLIEEAGLKGKKIGWAEVSEKHGNFIINKGGATAEQVIILISVIKQKIRNHFGLQLQEELRYLGF